jgi:hypothetical protein
MDGISNDRAQRPHQDIKGREKDESFNFIGHEDYHFILIGGWKFFSVSLGTRILILNSIGGSNHPRFPLVHERCKGH